MSDNHKQEPKPPAELALEPYEPPRVVELGSLAELTAGHPPPVASDVTFQGSGIH